MTEDSIQQRIDAAFRQVSQVVWIVTAQDGARRGGLLATWAGRASIDPARPLATAAIAENHYTRELIDSSGAFALHLIAADQVELAWRFAIGSGRDRDKLAEVAHRRGASGSPILDSCVAWFDCQTFARHSTGDRIYYWADVLDAGQPGHAAPLRDDELFSLATETQLAELGANMRADIAAQRPLYETWRVGLSE
ncbi:MAG: flavin reductase [Planctomycetales bacterium]|nr:flavin reductase [Planctomycetales bacterium]